MSMRRIVPVLGIAALAACSDSLPVEQTGAPALGLSAVSSPASSRYAVLFKGSAPADFAARIGALGGTIEMLHKRAGIALVTGLSSDGVTSLRRDAAIDAVSADFTHQLTRVQEPVVKSAAFRLGEVSAMSQSNPTTAWFYPIQWNLPAIGAPTAWAKSRLGSDDVTVAILDSGIDYLHPDLNGLVDVAHSISFVPSDNPLIGLFPGGRLPISDVNGHGTIVASIVSSKAVGNAGVTSQVKLMAVKVLGWSGSGTFGGIIQGIFHATDNGADVINMSLGVEPFPRNEEDAKAVEKFIDRLTKYARAAGVTVVVASGNEGQLLLPNTKGLLAIFCSSKNVICVTGTGPLSAGPNGVGPFVDVDLWGSYSNYGNQVVDVAAPGGNGTATSAAFVWGSCSRTYLTLVEPPGLPPRLVAPCFTFSPTAILGSLGMIGTSGASPHVAALAALLVERMGRNPGAIEAAIQASADDVPFGKPGVDDQYGHGRINVAKALRL
jgi:lantibiotic leader peptide-processing serine protease